jgi:acetyl-CoA acetyltransferase
MLARRHFHQYGTTREQLAQIALTARHNAGLNPKAVYRDQLTLDEYMSAPMIADPLCIYDCDVHCDGSTAFVLSHHDYARDAPNVTVCIESIGMAPARRTEWALQDLPPSQRAADQMWGRTELNPADVHVAGLYDGFSMLTMLWLESLGFCLPGESGSFVENGERIAISGQLPLNTHGGQLSAGRLHGFGFIHEMCLQLRGQAEDRQCPGPLEVAAVAVGAAPYVGCMLLRRSAP